VGSTHRFCIGASCRRRQDKLQQTAAGLQVLHEIKSKMITSKETVVKILEQLTTIKRMKFVEKIFFFFLHELKLEIAILLALLFSWKIEEKLNWQSAKSVS